MKPEKPEMARSFSRFIRLARNHLSAIMTQNPGFFDALGVTIKARSLKEWAFMSSRADSLMSG